MPLHPSMARLLREDRRYSLASYAFVFEALEYAQEVMKLGIESETEPIVRDMKMSEQEWEELQRHEQEGETPKQHVTGQNLCEAARRFAIEQYGPLAHSVLGSLGIRATGDIGNIVYNLMKIGHMRKTPQDRREDFDDVFDWETGLDARYYHIGRGGDPSQDR